jgi:hypothetical protein
MTTPIQQGLRVAAAATLVGTLVGCASPSTPNFDAHFGQAVLAARAQQTINPDASANPNPPSGIDGRAARASIERYHDSFKTPPPSFNVINIGGGIGSN